MMLFSSAADAQGTWIDSILAVHGIKMISNSIQVTGTVDRTGKPESFRMIATSDERFRIDYGTAGKDAIVMGPKQGFHDDGSKTTYNAVPPGFAQLDFTNLFFVGQLRSRPVQVVTTGDSADIAGIRSQRIRVENDRSELHKGAVRVKDAVDLYVSDAGMLTAISRSFYEGRPEAYTQTFVFSDYRKTENGILPFQIDVLIKAQRRLTFKVDQYLLGVPADAAQFTGARAK